MYTLKRALIGIGAVCASALLGLSISFSATATTSNPMSAPKFESNSSGESYGSGLGADKDPDLIQAYGANGRIGYVRSVDLNGPEFRSPEEALAYQVEHRRLEGGTIPLYASDGRTVIGEFEVSSTVIEEGAK